MIDPYKRKPRNLGSPMIEVAPFPEKSSENLIDLFCLITPLGRMNIEDQYV